MRPASGRFHMSVETFSKPDQRRLLGRFWQSAFEYWRGPSSWRAWFLCALLLVIVVAQLLTQYALNYWNRDFFDALEQKNAAALTGVILKLFPLVGLSVALAVLSVWGRMTAQRQWREFVTTRLIHRWLHGGNFRKLGHFNGNSPQNPEYRIAEDSRVATDAPIDLALSLLSAVLTAATFFGILANVGGAITVAIGDVPVTIPFYLVFGAIAYSTLVTMAVLLMGRRLTDVVQDQIQAEATFRAAANFIREAGDGLVVSSGGMAEYRQLWEGLRNVIRQWRFLCWQLMRVTLVTNANTIVAPVAGLLLCAPKYLDGAMSLGEVTQAAAAFVVVQGAFNWFVDNFQRMADWRASALRVAALMLAIDELDRAGELTSSESGPAPATVPSSG